ncbi:hypothetical protein ES705_37325 [subsurface metagenome]
MILNVKKWKDPAENYTKSCSRTPDRILNHFVSLPCEMLLCSSARLTYSGRAPPLFHRNSQNQ